MSSAKKVVLSIVLCAILMIWGITVAYASLSITLNIEGSGYVNASSWNIEFANLVKDYNNTTENQAPIISTTSISNFNITFNGLNSTAEYEFDIVNNGTFNAEIDLIQVYTPVCTGSGTDKIADENLVCGNFDYTLVYIDNTTVQPGDLLNAGETKRVRLTYTYTTDLKPKETVDITDLGASIFYVQQ